MLTLKTQLTLPLLLRFRFPQALPPPCCHFSAVLILDPAHLFLDQKEAPSFDFRSSTYTKVSIPLLRKRCLFCRAQTFSSTFAIFLLPPLRKRFHFRRSPIFSSTFAIKRRPPRSISGLPLIPKSLFHFYENSSTSAKHKLSLPL